MPRLGAGFAPKGGWVPSPRIEAGPASRPCGVGGPSRGVPGIPWQPLGRADPRFVIAGGSAVE